MHKLNFSRTGVAVLALLLVLTAGLGAQQTVQSTDHSASQLADGDSEGVDVIVTAARTEESELSTPAHITVITAQEIMESGEQSLVGILDTLAGVKFTSYSGPQQAQIDMRGFGENSHGRVLVMVDGRRLNSQDMSGIQWLSIPLESIERVEVVHGSNSVMYGNHAVGGVVNIITKDSTARTEFASSVDFGAYNSSEFNRGVFSSQRVRYGTNQDATDGSVTFAHSTNDGHRERSASRSVNTLLNGGWDITEILRAEADLGYQWNEYQMPGALTEAQYESDPSQAVNDADEAEEHDLSTFLSVEWFPFYNIEVSLDGGYRYQAVQTDTPSMPSYINRTIHTVEANPKLIIENTASKTPWDVIGGIDLYSSSLSVARYADENRDNLSSTSNLDLKSVGAYAKPTFILSDSFVLKTGVRYDLAQIKGTNDASGVDDQITHQAFVYDGALLFQPTENTKLYFKGGTLFFFFFTDEQASLNGFVSDGFNADLNPETGVNVELGAAFIEKDSVTLKINGYFLQMNDEIAADPTSPSYNSNLDKTRRIGADVDLELTLLKAIKFDSAYSFVDARFANGDNENKQIPLVPSHSLETGLTLHMVKHLTIRPEFKYRSATYMSGDEANVQDKLSGYSLFNFEVNYSPKLADGDMNIKLKTENLFDSLYATYASNYGTASFYPAPGRSISISASYSY